MAIPVSLADARRQLKMEDNDASRDGELSTFIADAAAWIEQYTGHILVARDVIEQFTGFARLQLRAWPVKPGAAVVVAFTDAANANIVIAAPRLFVERRPARVLSALGTCWPPVAHGIVTVTVRAGYEAGDSVPGNLRRAMLVLISAYDADREGGEVFAAAEKTARLLCSDFRARGL